MTALRIVTDGAADLPSGTAEALGIEVVHGVVHFDGMEWTGTNDEFWCAVKAGTHPSTSPPSAEEFTRVFARSEPVCAVLVSSELSHTVEHAEEAAGSRQSVHVVDSRSLGVGTGLLAVLAAQSAEQSPELGRLKLLLPRLVDRLHVCALIENVDYLVRGGRAGLVDPPKRGGWRQLVAVKGHVIPLEQVHRRQKAIDVLLRHVRAHLAHGVEQWAVGHGDAADVDEFTEKALRMFGSFPQFVVPMGPTVGTHAGPGALALAFLAEG